MYSLVNAPSGDVLIPSSPPPPSHSHLSFSNNRSLCVPRKKNHFVIVYLCSVQDEQTATQWIRWPDAPPAEPLPLSQQSP